MITEIKRICKEAIEKAKEEEANSLRKEGDSVKDVIIRMVLKNESIIEFEFGRTDSAKFTFYDEGIKLLFPENEKTYFIWYNEIRSIRRLK